MSQTYTYITGNYNQASKWLLLPLVGLERVSTVSVTNTYLYWKDNVDNLDDMNNVSLLVYYEPTTPHLFEIFEKNVLMKLPNVTSCFKTEKGYVYVIDMLEWADDIVLFLEGKYSQFSQKAKDEICSYYNLDVNRRRPFPIKTVHMALFPEYYYESCAKELGYTNSNGAVNVAYLQECVELWSKPDVERETFDQKIVGEDKCCPQKENTLL